MSYSGQDVGIRENSSVLSRIADELGARSIAEEAAALSERSEAGLFFMACVGQFKRGKSTLLNALLGEHIVPTGVVPVTTAVTVLRYGPRREARVRFADGHSESVEPEAIASFVSEEENPENEKGVRAVEVFLPNPLLSGGMCLVDTPGIGSVFMNNTAATREFVPHIDAALVVLGADPPISGEELALLKDVSTQVSVLVYILNKSDRLSEADREQAIRFTEQILSKHLKREIGKILEVSAIDPGAMDWNELRSALEKLARDSGANLAIQGAAREAQRLVHELRLEISERRLALMRPIEDSQTRVETLQAQVGRGERALRELSYLLDSEYEQLSTILDEKRDAFLESAPGELRPRLADAIAAEQAKSIGKLRTRALELARKFAEEILNEWRAEIQPLAERHYHETEERFVRLANDFAGWLRDAGEEVDGEQLNPESSFRIASRLYYTSLISYASQTVPDWLLEKMRTREKALRSVLRDAQEYMTSLLAANSSRVVHDILKRALESRRQLESVVRQHLQEIVDRAVRALETAQRAKASGQAGVEEELRRLAGLETMLPGATTE